MTLFLNTMKVVSRAAHFLCERPKLGGLVFTAFVAGIFVIIFAPGIFITCVFATPPALVSLSLQ